MKQCKVNVKESQQQLICFHGKVFDCIEMSACILLNNIFLVKKILLIKVASTIGFQIHPELIFNEE